MNKYFLSLISILILFQSFVVFDEIFYHDNAVPKKGFIVINSEKEIEPDDFEQIPNSSKEAKIDITSIFKTADIEKGMKISKQCLACHDFSNSLKIKTGPPLWGVVGRKAAVIADYKYSDALKNFQENWTRTELFNFLEQPKEYIKGTKMIYKGLTKINDRVNLISYLESLK
jgi:cytochrome c